MGDVDAQGGMYAAVQSGYVQRRIGESARAYQARVESGEQAIVGVNKYAVEEDASARPALPKPDPALMQAHLDAFARWKSQRSQAETDRALTALARASQGRDNTFGAVVAAAIAGCTHGEICATLRRELGFGQPLVVV
jgi:methylmalonyl-CoA mutase N-terminal domain/subunit